MSAQSMVSNHRSQLMQLRGLADRDIAALLAAVSGAPVAEVRNTLIEALSEVVAPYLAASGELAAVLIEDLRAEAGRRGVFYAESATPAFAPAKVDGTVRWAVGPLADETLEATVATRLSGSVARAIMDASRDTMMTNGAREGVRFQRMPRPGCCAFCGMLASRPPWMAYKSEASAGGVVGRGVEESRNFNEDGSQRLFGNRMAGGVRARGKREIGAATHDECHCVIVPLYPGSAMAALAGSTRRSYEEKYRQSLTDESGKQLSAPKDILAEWRRYHGTR